MVMANTSVTQRPVSLLPETPVQLRVALEITNMLLWINDAPMAVLLPIGLESAQLIQGSLASRRQAVFSR